MARAKYTRLCKLHAHYFCFYPFVGHLLSIDSNSLFPKQFNTEIRIAPLHRELQKICYWESSYPYLFEARCNEARERK